MGKPIEEIATLAANWWAYALMNPKFDNGDTSFRGLACQTMARKMTKEVSEYGKAKFVEYLAKEIVNKLEQGKCQVLHVDYGPDMVLSAAAVSAGVSTSNFPWKTTMWISKNQVHVMSGYTGALVALYANKTHYRQQIRECNRLRQQYNNGYLDYIEDPVKRQARLDEVTKELEDRITDYTSALEMVEE